SDVALDLEHVRERCIERLAPAHLRTIVSCFHQFRTHLHATGPIRLPVPSYGAREQVTYAKLARDLLGREGGFGVLAGTQACDHLDVRNACELAAHRIGHPVGEVRVGSVAQVVEGKYRDPDDAVGSGIHGSLGRISCEPGPSEQQSETDGEASGEQDEGSGDPLARLTSGWLVRRW